MASFVDNFSDLQELGINISEGDDALSISFTRAADHLQKLLPNIENQTLLTLYGYYKQGTEGPCNAPKPSWYDMRGKAKWEAWNKLGDMPQEQAKVLYVDTIKTLDPSFLDSSGDGTIKEHWAKVSSMVADNSPSSTMTVTDYIKSNNIVEVKKYLESEYSKINTLDEEGLALIHWATDCGNLEMVKLLIEAGADLNIQDSEGQTPLHYASSCGHFNCAEYLLSQGAQVMAFDNDGNSPADITTDDEIKKLLVK